MKIPTRASRLARRNPLGGWIARVLAAVVLAAPGVMLTGCGDSGPPTGIGPSVTPDTSTLAGTWKGSVDGSYGFSVMTMFLKADSSLTMEAEKPEYCKVSGTWSVSSVGFTSTGRDCTGTIVSTLAPVNGLRLTGTWSASSGRSGTFTVAKQ
jgi:hypothetical protein